MKREFAEFSLLKIEEWGRKIPHIGAWPLFWSRMGGENSFCKGRFKPEEQWYAKRKGDYDRYTQFNYCHGVHGTLEFRTLPMFHNVKDAVDAVKLFIACADGFIKADRANSPKEKPCVLRVDLQEAA